MEKKRNLNHSGPNRRLPKSEKWSGNGPTANPSWYFPSNHEFWLFFNDIPVLRHTGRDFFSVSSSFQSVEASVVRLYNEDQYQVNISSVTL